MKSFHNCRGVLFLTLLLVSRNLTAAPEPSASATPSPQHLQNLSARAQVRTGDAVLIGGVIISGNTPKQVLFRAIGAGLTINGIPFPGRLADPTLTLFRQGNSTPIAQNDNWKDTQQSAITATGKQPANDLDSAVLAMLDPGNYTIMLRGKNNGTGIALVEAYEIENDQTRLMNVSSRGVVEAGDNVMIGGFIVVPNASGPAMDFPFLIRAIGPSLAAYGVANPIQDPLVQLFDANGTMIASNDDWRSGAFIDIERTGYAPQDDRESVIYGAVSAGAYTAIMTGKGQPTGTGLLEIYDASSFPLPAGQ